MDRPFRIIDTGLRDGARNIAFDAALIALRKEGRIPDTIRFLQFEPSALVGRHQDLSRELRLDYCAEQGIGVVRRITGGGSLYMDEGQFGFEFVFDKSSLGLSSLAELTCAICEAAAAGLSRLGIAARYRPRNDIEVGGRKISGTGGFFDGDTIFYQGTVLVEMDKTRMLGALNVPEEKLAKRTLDSAGQRVATLTELLGAPPPLQDIKAHLIDAFREHLGISPEWGEISAEEEARAEQLYRDEIGTAEFIHSIDDPGADGGMRTGNHQGAGGTVRAHVRLEGPGLNRFREVLITGDFFVAPPRLIFDLEARLRGSDVAPLRETVEAFFAEAKAGLLSVKPEDFATAIQDALGAAVPA